MLGSVNALANCIIEYDNVVSCNGMVAPKDSTYEGLRMNQGS